ncbi:MAG: plasmid stabilization protein [Alphaproteobacteria bacterium]
MSIIIRDPDNQLSRALEARAKKRGVSIEEEARQILQRALAAPDDLGAAIRNRFQPLGEVELDLPAREPCRDRKAPMS